MDVFRTFVSEAADVEANREELAQSPGGEGMLTTQLSPTGLSPATHYISSGLVKAELSAKALMANSMVVTNEDPFKVMADMGLQMVVDPVVAQQPKKARNVKRK